MEKLVLFSQSHNIQIGLFVVASLAVAGCGSNTPFPMTQIEGTVTYEDGTAIPADRVTVTFVPQVPPIDAHTHPRSAYAIAEQGTGKLGVLTTSKYGDGVIRGKQKVLVVAVDKRDRQLPVIPPAYASEYTTPVEIDTADSPITIEIPRPKGSKK